MPLLGLALFGALIYAIVQWPMLLMWIALGCTLGFIAMCVYAFIVTWAENSATRERRVARDVED